MSQTEKIVKINESDIDEIFEEMERREDIDVDAQQINLYEYYSIDYMFTLDF